MIRYVVIVHKMNNKAETDAQASQTTVLKTDQETN